MLIHFFNDCISYHYMDVLGVDDMTAIFNMKGLVTVRSVPMQLSKR